MSDRYRILELEAKLSELTRERDEARQHAVILGIENNPQLLREHIAMKERAESAESLNRELRDALAVIAEALKEPAGGSYCPARQFLDKRDFYHEDVSGERVLLMVADAALKSSAGE